MTSCSILIDPDAVVLDVGAHIGYLTLYFARLAREGFVYAFEPAPSNLSYLERNVADAPNVRVVPVALGDAAGQADLYVDSLSGQNSSLLVDLSSLRQTEERAHVRSRTSVVRVPVIRLDDFIESADLVPNFVKIDVEGFEQEVLNGATRLLTEIVPMLMVEVTRNTDRVDEFLGTLGYVAFDPDLRSIGPLRGKPRNTFFLHREAHKKIFDQIGDLREARPREGWRGPQGP